MSPKRRKTPAFGPLLRGFVASELERAERLFGRSGHRLNTGIHQGRKSLRRTRAAIALADGALGREADRIDRTVRAICRSLSRERDAQAVIDTLKRIALSSGIAQGDLKAAVAAMKKRRDTLLAARQARDPELAALRRRLRRAAHVADGLAWDAVEARHIHEALARSLRRCGKSERRALHAGDALALHRWRRRLRRLRQQLAALDKLTGLDWSEYAAVPDPADALSEAQDLDVLLGVLRRVRGLDRDRRRRLLDALAQPL